MRRGRRTAAAKVPRQGTLYLRRLPARGTVVSDPFLVGVFFGLVPAMGFLYILLHRFEGLFQERKAFFAFFIGLAGGLLVTLMQLFFRGDTAVELGLLTVLFGVLHAFVFAAFLNSRRFRGKRDTPFYGVAFGLGFGALNVLFLIGNTVPRVNALNDVVLETITIVLIGLYFIGSILVHASVGAWIGRGTATRKLGGEILRGAVAETIYLALFYIIFVPRFGTILIFVALAASIALIGYVLNHVLEPLIPEEVRREIEIHQRRLARQIMREGTSRSSETDPAEARTDGSTGEAPPPPAPPSP